MSYNQNPRDQYYNNQDPRNQYYNNHDPTNYYNNQDQYYGNQSGLYQEEYVDEYQQGQLTTNPRVLEINDYRPSNNNPYPVSNSNMRGGRAADDDDNASLGSSIYSQPSVVGATPLNNARYYQEQSTDPRQQSLSYNDYDYPPSPFAASTNTHNTNNSATGLTAGLSQQGLPINEKNYMEENHYHNPSQNTQPQFDVYKDFNNLNNPSQNAQPQFDVYKDFNNFQSDETYDEESRHDTLTGSDARDPNSYMDTNRNSPNNGKNSRFSTAGEHYVVKKERRCAFCSRKTCVIITFIVLALLAAGMYFVWPRIPSVQMLSSSPTGDAVITLSPPVAKMSMDLQFQLDNTNNWLPYKFNSFNTDVFDAANLGTSNRPIASGVKKGFTIPGRTKTTISVPISIDYTGSAPNDPVLQDLVGACTQPQGGGNKSFLNFRFDVTMFIMGLDWIKKPSVVVPVTYFQCPFNATAPADPSVPAPTDPAAAPTDSSAPAPTDPSANPAPAPSASPAPAANPAPAPSPAANPAPGAPAPANPAPGAPAPAASPAPAPANPAPGAPAPAANPAPTPAANPAPGAPAPANPAPGAPAPTNPAPGAPAPANPAPGAPAPANPAPGAPAPANPAPGAPAPAAT